jgi:hypothetical protein
VKQEEEIGSMREVRGAKEDIEIGELDPRRRATLLESQAEELRQRLDTLLDEIGRHHRRRPAQMLRHYAVPIACSLALAGVGLFFLLGGRHPRRELWVRVGTRAQGRLHRLISS